ncbi:MAG: glycosyltransferase family 2 protein [Phycisphaerales bacterium]|nr:glycosyltransferase family 2 protein [Phycisphaerales bacterium]
MYKDHWIVAIIPAHNEEARIGRVVDRARASVVDTVLVVNDCSTDATAAVARSRGATVLTHARRRGVGAALRTGIEHARRAGYDIAVILAGNNKDDPAEIPRLLDPIADDRCDLVMGSRYLPGGGCGGDMPLYRRLATRLHPWFMSRFSGKRVTESTNGFRAFRLSLLDDWRINLRQRWLDTYGLEVYLLWKTIKLGYRHAEVPCTKIYPRRNEGYTKMRPVTDWWSILRPVFLLGLGFRD